MLDILNSAARASLVTFVLCGFAYPLTVTMLGQWLMPFQANGSLIKERAWRGPGLAADRPAMGRSTVVSWTTVGDHGYRS